MKPSIQKKLQSLLERHEELSALLSEAEVINKQNVFREYSKEYAQTEPVVNVFRRHLACMDDIKNAKDFMGESDPELQELGKQELKIAEELVIQMMIVISSLKFVRAPVVMKPRFFQGICRACIRVMRKIRVGKLK
jgi:peptide chain release factor 1